MTRPISQDIFTYIFEYLVETPQQVYYYSRIAKSCFTNNVPLYKQDDIWKSLCGQYALPMRVEQASDTSIIIAVDKPIAKNVAPAALPYYNYFKSKRTC